MFYIGEVQSLIYVTDNVGCKSGEGILRQYLGTVAVAQVRCWCPGLGRGNEKGEN